MGVPQIWELLRPYLQDKRVPLKKFVSDFKFSHGRSPRIAIDGYSWLFECGFILNQETPGKYASHGTIGKAVLNFVYRLKELLALNITFILVFDGSMKPSFKKNFGSPLSCAEDDYWSTWNSHMEIHERNGHCLKIMLDSEGLHFMQVVKGVLGSMRISYVEACGEGEAQCAWLQRNGHVDYVLTNDSDALVFGATRLLRNYSKFTNDLGATGNSPLGKQRSSSKDLFVTVVDLDQLNSATNDRYNWWSLLFFSVLLGADYNQGVKGMGKVKAAKLAQLQDPDFAQRFRDMFADLRRRPQLSEYQNFQQELTEFCKDHSVELFDRNYRAMLGELSLEGWPSLNAIMYYFHPILIPQMDFQVFDKSNVNISGSNGYKEINFLQLQAYLGDFRLPAVTNFEKWFTETILDSFLLRRLLSQDRNLTDYVQIVDQRTFEISGKWPLSCWKIKYKPYILFFQVGESGRNSFPYTMWIPQGLIPQDHILITKWKRTPKSKTPSPSKSKISPQKNTLDSFLKKHASPVKDFSPAKKIDDQVTLEPVKKRLFVDSNDSSNDSEDDSLVILDEITLKDNSSLSTWKKRRQK
ncbi:ZYRO0E08932p [Zygosaccharomyces rouxii]|uniref:ZYRO0E08932p n=1 Tax=Zygosaccharomyces rouxii (strain ATCC 2623 / CBS 732 / NBRC 1130 / NCYC 568 / NRRL Y-229) TaxID=559307 RepID=C5E4U9_ZYGRC|nr:uncharacterized protein ZYRO0E08932g [Zygosaccharomyces rouxii]KAH9198084.1 PIN domain-like protein [Zygosaccharomyces rouxii]CAR31060.1 ZYRO0E08932p [Zygosaccharomyces rouxii]